MNRAVDAYLAELEARRFSHSRRYHSARTLERLILYLREAHSITDWRAVNETPCVHCQAKKQRMIESHWRSVAAEMCLPFGER